MRAVAARARAATLLVTLIVLIPAIVRGQALSLSIASRSLQPGEVVIASVIAPPDTTAVSVSGFGAETAAVKGQDGTWQALLGIDLDTRPGTYTVVARATAPSAAETRQRLVVQPKRFARRTLRVAPQFVDPPPEVLERITTEAAALRDAYARTSTEPAWHEGFARPVPDRANSSFGVRSVFNGQPRSPHTGTDFSSPEGRPVVAPAGGRVVIARDLFFTGNTVVIDHGLGVFSLLAHLSRIDVIEGDVVAGGAPVALVGATGRVTGPHLHWALRIGTARVDALAALALLPMSR